METVLLHFCCQSTENNPLQHPVLMPLATGPGNEHWPSSNRRATGVMIEILDSFVAHRLCPVSKQKNECSHCVFEEGNYCRCSLLRYFIVSGGFTSPPRFPWYIQPKRRTRSAQIRIVNGEGEVPVSAPILIVLCT